MDQSLLSKKGLRPVVIGSALLHGYRIHIGERATLLPSPSNRAYGVVMELSDEDADLLYSEPSVQDYRPELVRVELFGTSEIIEASCYNLGRELALAGANPSYALELARLAQALQFDSTYVQEIAEYGEA